MPRSPMYPAVCGKRRWDDLLAVRSCVMRPYRILVVSRGDFEGWRGALKQGCGGGDERWCRVRR